MFIKSKNRSCNCNLRYPLFLALVLGLVFSPYFATQTHANTTHLQVDTFTASGTWTAPAGVTSATIEVWGSGGGGTTNTGGGGGGAYSRSVIEVVPAQEYDVVIGAVAGNTDGGDSYFNNTSTVMAKGGLSSSNGGTGGQADDGVGDIKFSGGNGVQGTGIQNGGGGAGDAGNASGSTPGATNGGSGQPSTNSPRIIASGGGSATGGGFSGGRGEARITYETDGQAGFPVIKSRAWSRVTANGTSHAITMPSGITVGDLLLAVISFDGTPTLSGYDTSFGWTLLVERAQGSTQKTSIFYKVAEGSDTLTVTTSASEQSAAVVLRIQSFVGVPTVTGADGSSTNANPPEHDAGTSSRHLWIAAAGWDQSASFSTLDSPANYGSLITIPADSTQGTGIATTERFLETQVEDPVAFTSSSEQWVAFTIAIEGLATTPTLTTSLASLITHNGATLNGEVTDNGGASVTEHGFAYGTESDLNSAGDTATSTLGAIGVETFNQALSSLDPETTYYFRAYATNSEGTSYGDILSFETDSAPVVPDEPEPQSSSARQTSTYQRIQNLIRNGDIEGARTLIQEQIAMLMTQLISLLEVEIARVSL